MTSFPIGSTQWLKSGDVISIATASNKYADDNGNFYAASINEGDFCGIADTYCMAAGICNDHFANISAESISYPVSTVSSFKSLTNYTIFAMRETYLDSQKWESKPNGTPIRFGDYVVFFTTIGGKPKAWQTGAAEFTSSVSNDFINLNDTTLQADGSGIISEEYQIWVINSPANIKGVFQVKPELEQSVDAQAVYYGFPYTIQSVGKAIDKSNYQYATLSNTLYDCGISTQDIGSYVDPSDYNKMFTFLNSDGLVPNLDGTTSPPIKAGRYRHSGYLGGLTVLRDILLFIVYAIIFLIITAIIAVAALFFL